MGVEIGEEGNSRGLRYSLRNEGRGREQYCLWGFNIIKSITIRVGIEKHPKNLAQVSEYLK